MTDATPWTETELQAIQDFVDGTGKTEFADKLFADRATLSTRRWLATLAASRLVKCATCGRLCADRDACYGCLADDRARELAASRRMYKRLVEDLFGDFDCLPTCDSVAHDEECPGTQAVAATHALREELAASRRAQEALEQERDRLAKLMEGRCGTHYDRIIALERQLREVDEALTEMGWHTDRGLLERVRSALAPGGPAHE
jgi:hypothetical protein